MAGDLTTALHDVLAADATLMALLTGGIYTTRTLGTRFISEAQTPSAYAAGAGGIVRLKPCCVVTPSGGAMSMGAAGCGRQEWVRIGVYDAEGYATTEAALDRVRALLHDTNVDLTDGRSYDVQHVDTPYRAAEDDSVVSGTGRAAAYEAARYVCTTVWP